MSAFVLLIIFTVLCKACYLTKLFVLLRKNVHMLIVIVNRKRCLHFIL